ncbi:hypothetical protein ACH42_07395 [Endozoicomonas sp. (ex Bugula neritina AB1)]|nr:hypothetical protein ACH42_07395 [Endozoicomonas sp. (ex Bugula neritina AB1)]
MNPFVYAIPIFFILIIIEVVITVLRKKDYYRLNDAINSLSTGMLMVTSGQVIKVSMYAILYQYLALLSLPSSEIWVWILAFILKDFFYYWHHRMGHEVNILWAAHAVHHQSEEYNLTTALRQTSTGSLFGWVFYIPMAILGIPPYIFAVVSLANLLYQFWVHTRHIPKLGWFEWGFVSPSNHRVHHGKNRKYLDKNYGGVFIIWDRLFGTFEEEDDSYEVIRYGTLKPLRSWNPVWANTHLYADMISDAVKTTSWKDKFQLWFKQTGYRPKDVAAPMSMPDIYAYENYNPETTMGIKFYVIIQFTLLMGATTLLTGVSHIIPYWSVVLLTVILALNLVCMGWLMEGTNKFRLLEAGRFCLSAIASFIAFALWPVIPQMLGLLIVSWGGLSLVFLLSTGIGSHEEKWLLGES